MIDIKDKTDCCGCWACAQVCPQQCISMAEDDEGFRYPHADPHDCIDCGLCEKVCPIINRVEEREFSQRAYLLQHKDEQVLKESTSGGAYTAIATYVIRQGGVVFGAAYDKDFRVVHKHVDKTDDLGAFRNSKYVQSYVGDAYREARDFLRSGRMVCFSGTPCQIEGLLHFLRKPYPNLLTVDVVCRAIASPKVFSMYVDLKREELGSDVDNIKFRDKRPYGYKYSSMSVYRNGRQVYREGVESDVLLRSFFSNINVRPSCYHCRFKKRYRMSDFTIWECFDVYRFSRELDNDKGVTRLLAHSEKAVRLLSELSSEAYIVEIDADAAVAGVKELKYSVKTNERREAFFSGCGDRSIGGKVLYSFFPISFKTLLEKYIRVSLCRLGIYAPIKKLAKTVIKDVKRS